MNPNYPSYYSSSPTYGNNLSAGYGPNYGADYGLSQSGQQAYYQPAVAQSSPLSRIGSSGSSASQVSTTPTSPMSNSYYTQQCGPQGSPDPYQYQNQYQYQNTSRAGEASASGWADMASEQGASGGEQAGESSHDRRDFPCLVPGCTSKPFRRNADLVRHYKNKHAPESSRDAFPCDYPNCGRRLDAFHRLDHFRDHLRDFHQEDIEKRGKNLSSEWLDGRRVRRDWWRCSRCLKRIYVDENGDDCPTCKTKCQPERMKRRRS